LRDLNSRQITGWIDYYTLEPFGPLTEALFSGTVASAVYNSKRTKGSTGRRAVPEDFFPVLRRKQTVAEQYAALSAWVEATKEENTVGDN
jgi:hypothetical protein